MAEPFHGLVDGKEYDLVIGSSFRQRQSEDFYHTIKCKSVFLREIAVAITHARLTTLQDPPTKMMFMFRIWIHLMLKRSA